ncbi:hypothetical protein SRRS_06890 [Sporomusa rhizae]|uniref:hypothetical protein n=1 Tax=Sporomusa rhizae TaxID=357999 RepID=UPI00352AC8D1
MGKAAKSHRLPYSKPKAETDLGRPASTRAGYHPVHCIKNNIPLDQAFCLKPEDLTESDYRTLFDHGTRKQTIKRLYGFRNDAEFYKWLRSHDLYPSYTPTSQDLSSQAESPVDDPVAESSIPNQSSIETKDEVIIDPAKFSELMSELLTPETTITPDYKASIYKDFSWFYGQRPIIPILTVYEDGRFAVPVAIRKNFEACLCIAGLSSDGKCLVIAPTEESGFRLKHNQVKYRDIEISKALSKLGITFPARYTMKWNEPEQAWEGTLILIVV